MGRGIRFATEFKREAVRLALMSGRSRAEIAEDPGVGLSSLTRWVGQYRGDETPPEIKDDLHLIRPQKLAGYFGGTTNFLTNLVLGFTRALDPRVRLAARGTQCHEADGRKDPGHRRRRIKLGSLHPTRDFTFVTDTAKGFMAAAECDATVGQVVNIGSGFEISVGDVVALIVELMGQASRSPARPSASGPRAARSSGFWRPPTRHARCSAGRPSMAAWKDFAVAWRGRSSGSATRRT